MTAVPDMTPDPLDPQDRATLEGVLDRLAAKLRADEPTLGVRFPYVTAPDGAWMTMPASASAGYDGDAWSHGNWFCGFWVGLLVAAWHRSGDDWFLETARERMKLTAERATDPNTHDIGFIFSSSAVPLYMATGETRWRDLGLTAARQLRARVVRTPEGAYVSSWGPLDDPRGRVSSAIDTMANIPLLYWASAETGDASFALAAEAHARMTAGSYLRDDDTLYHAVEFDVATGRRTRGFTFQGYGDESSWSRGAGWAVIGFVASYAATGDPAFQALGARIARRWLEQLGDRTCPPWDFDDPAETPDEDSAAGAIMAGGLLDLAASYEPDDVTGQGFRASAIRLLTGLARSHLLPEQGPRGILTGGCYARPQGIGVDAAVLFGDFFFVQAVVRLVLDQRFAVTLSRV